MYTATVIRKLRKGDRIVVENDGEFAGMAVISRAVRSAEICWAVLDWEDEVIEREIHYTLDNS